MCTAACVSSFDNLNHIDAPSTWTCRYDRRILTQQALIWNMIWRYLAHLAFSVLVLCLELGTSTICFHEYPLATFVHPAPATFENVADTVFPLPLLKQSEIHTSPNCIFPQWDTKLQKWDTGSFCHEEILTGGACVGDPNNDRYPDIFFPSIHKNGCS